jgi:hypothetical protein
MSLAHWAIGHWLGGETVEVPSVPTLVVTDNGDGTGATATISGADAQTTNTVYYSMRARVLSWANGGNRVGNGNISISLDIGSYFFYVVSQNGIGCQSISLIVTLAVTDGSAKAILVRVLDAVTSELNGAVSGAFSKVFTAVRSYDATRDFDSTDDAVVDVIRVGSRLVKESRNTFVKRCTIDIAVRHKYDPVSERSGSENKLKDVSVDADVLLLEEIEDYLADPARQRLVDYDAAMFVPSTDPGDKDQSGIRVTAAPSDRPTGLPGIEDAFYLGVLRVHYDVGLKYSQ